MHFCFKKSDSSQNIDKQFFLYQTIENQIKLVKAVDMDCYEVIGSMLSFENEQNKGINFEIKRISDANTGIWSPPLLKLFIDYIYEIAYYIMPIQRLNTSIFHEYFLYGKEEKALLRNKYIDESINFNKHRLKTILNIILGSINSSDKTFLKILWKQIKYVIFEEQLFIYHKKKISSIEASSSRKLIHNINKKINDAEMSNFKMFFVSALVDIETVHKESQENKNVSYEPVIDPYNNLPEPPKMPIRPVISQELQRYKMTSDIKGKNTEKEKELKEYLEKEKQFKKELKSYDKKLKEYNDKYLGKKLSPYFSVKLSRARSVINDKNSLRLSYSPLKVTAKSLTNFKPKKNKELLAKFEKEPYSRTYKGNEEEQGRQKELWEGDLVGGRSRTTSSSASEVLNLSMPLPIRVGSKSGSESGCKSGSKSGSKSGCKSGCSSDKKSKREEKMDRITQKRKEATEEREREMNEIRQEKAKKLKQAEQKKVLQKPVQQRKIVGELISVEKKDKLVERWSEATNKGTSRALSMSHSIRSGNKGGRSIGSAYSSGGNPQKEYLQILQGGGNKKELSKSDLKLQLALEAHKFKEFAKSPSPSGKSPRQKYIGCDLNANDPITLETLGDLHLKKIKYLSKIKTKLPDGKIITHCYDTIPFYNYILSCYNKNEEPKNLAIGRELLTTEQKNEVFKKIKYFTKQPTLKSNININKKYFLKAKYISKLNTYVLEALINIGSIDFDVINYNKIDRSPPPLRRRRRYPSGLDPALYFIYDNYVAERRERRERGSDASSSTFSSSSNSANSYDLYEVEPTLLHTGPILSGGDILFEDTSDATVLLIKQGMANGSLLKLDTYPYWIPETQMDISRPTDYKFLLLPPDNFSPNDKIKEKKEKTKVFNNRLRIQV